MVRYVKFKVFHISRKCCMKNGDLHVHLKKETSDKRSQSE